MQAQPSGPLSELFQQLSSFLPALTAGLLVIVLGLIVGWLAKRAVVRVLVWLRLDRLAGRAGWRAAFGKGDVRAALYDLAGNLVGAGILLVFLDDAMNRLGLTVLSRYIENIVLYLPNLVLVAIIVTIGLTLSNGLAERLEDALEEEGLAHARLVRKIVKGALIAVVVALGLWQLHFAREIVLAAFLISFGSIGIAFALAAGIGTARAIEQGLGNLIRKKRDDG